MNEKGFTIIELLISFFVIAIVSSITFVSFRSGEDTFALDRAARKVAQDIRKTAGYALQKGHETYCSGGGTLSGYGVYMDQNSPNSYFIFANCSESSGTPKLGYTTSGGDKDIIVKTITLDEAVQIYSVVGVPSAGNWNDTSLSTAFFPPDPSVALCSNDQCTGNNLLVVATIIIGLTSDSSVTKTININEGGFVDVD